MKNNDHWNLRIKALMADIGMPDSHSLYGAFMQLKLEMKLAAHEEMANSPALRVAHQTIDGLERENNRLRALLAESEGYKLVPIVPTQAMVDAGMWEDGSVTAENVWRAMVAAAQPAQDAQHPSEKEAAERGLASLRAAMQPLPTCYRCRGSGKVESGIEESPYRTCPVCFGSGHDYVGKP